MRNIQKKIYREIVLKWYAIEIMSTKTPERGVQNFDRWKRVVGLPPEFPKLLPIKKEQILEKAYIREDDISGIISRLPNPLVAAVAVIVKKGFGCTTLKQIVLEKIKVGNLNFMTRLLPIDADIEYFFNNPNEEIELESIIKRGILYNLVSDDWENPIQPPARYYNLIGAFGRGIGPLQSKDLKFYKTEILREVELELSEINWDTVYKKCPEFKKPLKELLETLKEYELKPALFFDIPYSASVESITNFSSYIQSFISYHSLQPGLLRETYFLTNDHYMRLKATWNREYDIIHFKPYNPAEIFKILNYHYRPIGVPSSVEFPLQTVFSNDFINSAWTKEKTLEQLAEAMEEEAIKRLDCGDEEINMLLEPLDEGRSHNKSDLNDNK